MPGKKGGTVRTTWNWEAYGDLTFPRDGYALPRRFHACATENPALPGVMVDVDVEIDGDGKARATSVTVASDKGIGWTALSTVSVRDIVGTAVLTALHTAKVEVTAEGEGRVHYMPIEQSKIPAEVREIVLTAVRYAPDLERFRRERAS